MRRVRLTAALLLIAVAGWGSWALAGTCASPTIIASGGGTVTGTTSGTSARSSTSCAGGMPGATASAPEEVFQWTPAVSGVADIKTCGAGTNFDTVIYLRTLCTGSDAMLCNGGSCCSDDACTNSFGVYRASELTPAVTAGQTYFIIVDGYFATGNFALTVTPPAGTATTTTLPAGGGCSSPTVIPASGGTLGGATSGAGALAGSCAGSGTAPEHVFRWTPAVSGTATIETCGAGTNFDTVLYMRSGTCTTGPDIACNDDMCPNSTGLVRASKITPAVTAGQTYFIIVDGYGAAQGMFGLTVTPPSGATTTTTGAPTTTTTTTTSTTTTTTTISTTTTIGTTTSTTMVPACNSPTVISAGGGPFTGATAGSSTLAGSCGGGLAPEKVFRWTPAVSGVATIQTCGGITNYNTLIYMRSGSCTDGEVAQSCNDDVGSSCNTNTGSPVASKVTPTVTAGQTYYIVVDGFDANSRGNFTLTVTPPTPDTTAPSNPSGITATANSCSQVTITWTGSTDNVGGSGLKGYNVHRTGPSGTVVFFVPAGTTSYTDTGVVASTAYTYGVSAMDNAVPANETATIY